MVPVVPSLRPSPPVIAIADATQTKQIVSAVRALTRTSHVIVRTRYVREMQANFDAGANEVIPEEFETSIEIFHRVLRKYLVPEAKVQDMIANIRNDHYGRLRGAGNKVRRKEEPLTIPGLEIATLPVTLETWQGGGPHHRRHRTAQRYGVTVLAIRRAGRFITNVKSEERILTDDLLYLSGSPENIVKLDRELR